MKSNFLLLLLLTSVTLNSQHVDKRLQQQLTGLLQSHKGVAGIYVMNLKNGKTAAYNADTVFPTASMVKVPIMIGIMQRINEGTLKYHQELIYRDSLLYEGVDILGSFKDSEKIELSKVLMLMLTTSDNTASLWLQSLAGGGSRMNALMDSLGLKYTKVNSRTPGRESDRSKYGWGQTTPKEMAMLLKKIIAGQALNKTSSDKMLRLLGRNYWDEEALSAIPAGVFTASKNGAVNESRSEVVYVAGKKIPYLFCICTKNNKDTSWTENNEAWVLTKKVSALLWNHFNE